jgi:hypothetical protein
MHRIMAFTLQHWVRGNLLSQHWFDGPNPSFTFMLAEGGQPMPLSGSQQLPRCSVQARRVEPVGHTVFLRVCRSRQAAHEWDH